MVYL
jgi:hypothetical protein